METIALQTVILDSSFFGSGTRGDQDEAEGQVRSIDLPSDYIVQDPFGEFLSTDADRDMVDADGHENSGLASHVLLAAASSTEKARENRGRGIFTKALLELLRKESLAKLTYQDVIQRLADLPK
jgi:hypothetical protein